MTNEEAIEYNKNLREYMRITDTESEFKFLKENYEALDMAIKVLEQIPDLKETYNKGYKDGQKALAFHLELCKEEQEPCEDCISRAEAINAIEEYGSVWMEYTEEMSIHQIAERALKASKQSMYKILHDLPSVQPKPMQVDLEGDGYSDGQLVYDYGKCPKCGWDFEYGDKDWEEPYCCHCGQKLHWFESEDKE